MAVQCFVLVGGPMDQQVVMTPETDEPRLRFKVRDIDDMNYVMAVYERGRIADDFQEYTFREEVTINHESLAATNEDLWLRDQFEKGYKGFGADIGAYDGVSTSNTLLLERAGWQILCVEPQPSLAGQLYKNRAGPSEICACAAEDAESAQFEIHIEAPGGFSSLRPTKDHHLWHPSPTAQFHAIQVRVCRLDTLLRKYEFPRLDVLSVDTEGTEVDVLRGIDLDEWKPKAIVAESWDAENEVVTYLEAHGYRLVERREPNDLFLRA